MLHFGDFFLGGDEDGSLSIWSLWWMKFATLSLGQNFLNCDYLFYPEGVNLTFHTLPKTLGLMMMPLSSLLPMAAAYNLVAVFTFVASSLTAYWLARRLLDDGTAAFLAGVFFAFSAFRMGQSSHAHMLPTMLIPVYILLLLQAKDALFARSRSWPLFALAGVTLGLIAYDTEHYAIFLLVFTAAFWCFYLPLSLEWSPWGQRLRLLAGLGLTMLLAAVIFLPMLLAAARQVAQVGDIVRVSGQMLEVYSAEALSLFLPQHQWYLLGHPFSAITDNFRFWETTYLGWVALALAAVGAVRYRRKQETRLWLMTAMLFAILALGPTLYLAGVNYQLPLPYRLIHHLPLLNTIRTPGRYLVIATLALAILAGGGAQALLARLREKTYARYSVPIAAALIAVFFFGHQRATTHGVT